jgi:NADH:ubiquinone reductase (non-electrogenic)
MNTICNLCACNPFCPAQVEAFDTSLNVYGSLAFLLWRSVYITKQVSFRNRVLILFDWMKARVFGRDLSQF